MQKVKQAIQLIKSPNDDRIYKYLVLQNGMECILVSDPETEKSTASLAVKVGHLSDPVDRAGLAHFLEHMLFQGSTKYPGFDTYKQFISKNSGTCNASTNPVKTQYHFQIANDKFIEALDIFANVFISPLFDKNCVEKEMNAVNSEYQKNVQNDGRRFYQIMKISSKKNNEFLKFGCGNLETLKFDDTRERLQEFYQKYYSANQMKLTLYSNKNIEEMEDIVKVFEDVKNHNFNDIEFKEHPFLDNQEQPWNTYWTIKSVKKSSNLYFKWLIDYQFPFYESKPCSYLSHIIGGEMKNSIMSMLIEQQLALSMSCGYDNQMGLFSFFQIQVKLTKKGMENQEQVRQIVFGYVKMLIEKDLQEWIFKEIQLIDQLQFDFQDKSKALIQANAITTRLTFPYKREHILYAPYMRKEFMQNEIKNVLKSLGDFKNLRIYYLSQEDIDDEKDVPLTEKFYDAKYGFKEMPEKIKQEFENPVFSFQTQLKLDLPEPNRFLPQNLQFKGKDLSQEEIELMKENLPQLILDDNNTQIWHKQDLQFKTPKLRCIGHIYSLNTSFLQTEKISTLNNIYLSLFKEELKELIYEAELANVNFSLSSDSQKGIGVEISISGFDESIPNVLKEVMKELGKFSSQNKEKFEIFKKKRLENLENNLIQTPNTQISNFSGHIIKLNADSIYQKIQYTSQTTFEDFLAFQEQFLNNFSYQWFALGNIKTQECIDMIKNAQEILKYEKEKQIGNNKIWNNNFKNLPSQRSVQLQQGSQYFYEKIMDKLTDKNSCIASYFQFGPINMRQSLIIQILVNFMKQPVFSQLRTQEQLGYIVQTSFYSIQQVFGIKILVQSSVKCPQFLRQRINNFIDNFQEKVDSLDQETFEQYRNSVLISLKDKETNIYQQFNRFMHEIDINRFHFTRKQDMINDIQNVKIQDIQNMFQEIFGQKNKKLLEIHLIANEHIEENNQLKEENINNEKNYQEIKNVNTFKKQQVFYPDFEAKL